MRKNILDEMQEKKLLNIEHNGMWLAFCGLIAVISVQICMGAGFKQYAGEWIVLILLCFYTLVSCLKNGIWDRRFKPNLKTNALISLISALVLSAIYGVLDYRSYYKQGFLLFTVIFPALFVGVFTFVLCLASLQLSSYIYKKRKEKLEREFDEKQ